MLVTNVYQDYKQHFEPRVANMLDFPKDIPLKRSFFCVFPS